MYSVTASLQLDEAHDNTGNVDATNVIKNVLYMGLQVTTILAVLGSPQSVAQK